MIKFLSLGSGSSGNCYFVGIFPDSESRPETVSGQTGGACVRQCSGGVLIDAGVSLRCLKTAFSQYGLSTDWFSSILVTHDHMDHIRCLGSYCKKLSRTVCSSDVLIDAMSRHSFKLDSINAPRRVLPADEWSEVSDGISARYFVVPHDATQTIGYALRLQDGDTERRLMIMTDAGRVTDKAVEWARWADTVIFESNYDVDMLMGGSYTHELKMRICNGHGHLSNDECAAAVRRFAHPGLLNLFLCHLSENNNTPGLAYDCTKAALESVSDIFPSGRRPVSLRALPRRTPSGLIVL